jgi:SAM-dependent methyltransferase
LCDVIEHTLDDSAVLREASRALKPGGLLLITVPALPALWTHLDVVSGHKRRYTHRTLTDAMKRAGLYPEVARYFGTFLLPAQFIQRLALRRRPSKTADERLQLLRNAVRAPAEPVNSLLYLTMLADQLFGGRLAPAGTSLLAVGRAA